MPPSRPTRSAARAEARSGESGPASPRTNRSRPVSRYPRRRSSARTCSTGARGGLSVTSGFYGPTVPRPQVTAPRVSDRTKGFQPERGLEPATLTVLFTVAAQAVGALVIASILLAFQHHRRRPHLGHWAWSWLSLAVSLVAGGVSFVAAGRIATAHPIRLGASVISAVAGYLQATWLLMGAYELAHDRGLDRPVVRKWLLWTAAVGLISI